MDAGFEVSINLVVGASRGPGCSVSVMKRNFPDGQWHR